MALNQVLAKGDPSAPGAAVALTIFGMKLFDCVHPPAAAYAFLAAMQGFTHPKHGKSCRRGQAHRALPLVATQGHCLALTTDVSSVAVLFPGLLGAVVLVGAQKFYLGALSAVTGKTKAS